MCKQTEDVMLGVITGPLVKRAWKPFSFTIVFNQDSQHWLTDKTLVTDHTTVGETNIAYLHGLLDLHLQDIINNTRTKR